MSAYGGNDVQEKLYDLEEEERRIHAELAAMDDEPPPPSAAAPRVARTALNSVLAECEREVRSVKGYVKENTQPLEIVRLLPGMKVPKSSTFLSRPKDTGVDFTVPVVLPDYLAVVKQPVFLNDVRDKCKRAEYGSAEDYLEDMRLLARNTAAYNKGESLGWVVQHARLLLEAAEDAVAKRRKQLVTAEAAVRAEASTPVGRPVPSPNASVTAHLPPPGKRRRSGAGGGVSGGLGGGAKSAIGTAADVGHRVPPPPPAGAASTQAPSSSVVAGNRLFVLWPDDMSWYSARVVKKMSVHRAEVEYDFDQTRQTVDLRVEKWRPMLASAAARLKKGEPPSKRHKASAGSTAAGSASLGVAGAGAAAGVGGGITKADLDVATEAWSANLDAMKASLLAEIHQRFDRMERSMQRSDPMMRVLLLVHELSDVVTDSTRRLEESIVGIEKRIGGGTGLDASLAGVAAGETAEGSAVEVENEGADSKKHLDGEENGDEANDLSAVVGEKDDAADTQHAPDVEIVEAAGNLGAADDAGAAGCIADAVTAGAAQDAGANHSVIVAADDAEGENVVTKKNVVEDDGCAFDGKNDDGDVEEVTDLRNEDAEMTTGENMAGHDDAAVEKPSDSADAVRGDTGVSKNDDDDVDVTPREKSPDDGKVGEDQNDAADNSRDHAKATVGDSGVELKDEKSMDVGGASDSDDSAIPVDSERKGGKLAPVEGAERSEAVVDDSDEKDIEASREESRGEDDIGKSGSSIPAKARPENGETFDHKESQKDTEALHVDADADRGESDGEKDASGNEEEERPVPMDEEEGSPPAKAHDDSNVAGNHVRGSKSGVRSGEDSYSSSSGSGSSREEEPEPMAS